MANRGFFQRRGDITNLVGRVGQITSALPTGNQENSVSNNFRIEGHESNSSQINQPYGFIGVNQPRSFNVTGGGGGGGSTIYYKMRGFFVSGSVYETYVVTGSPSATPPSGHTLIDVAIVSTWRV